MKNQTITTSLNFTSDVSDAISGLKKLREQMGNLTTDQSIFGNVDKEFEKIQKAMRDLAAKKEFIGTAKGAAEYKKILDSITVSANKIGQELTQIGTNANGAFKFKNVEQAQRVLTGLESNLKLVNKGLKDAQKELSTGLKNLGINDSIAKTIQGEENVIKLLKQEYEERKKTYELEKTRARETVANTFTKTWRQTPTTLISDIGNKDTKKTAAAAVDKAITDSLSEGVLKAQSWEKVQSNILERINATKIVVTDINMLLDSARQKYELSEKAVQRGEQEIVKVKQDMEAIGKINDEGVFEFSQGAQSAIDLANSVDKAKQSQTNLKGQVDATKQSIQQEGQIGQQSLNQITAGTEQAVQQTKNFVNAEHQATDSINEQNKEQEKLDKSMSKMQSWIVNILSIGNAWRKFTQVIRQTFNDVQKLDKAFASIAMVTDKTVENLWATYDDYADMANRLGQSTESAIKASALFYQQGLDTVEALKLTEDTMKLATLAGADFETATKQMTAALRGFHMEMSEGAHVTDVYSELAANAAADVNGIAYAMSKTASIASSAGMSFETTAAFLTNMIETTQEAPENIGTAMKTIIARFTELKKNVSASESEFNDLDYNKVDKALKSVGISIKDAQGQFRNLDEVFLELSQKWDTLDRNTQRYIATIAAGSRQQSRFIAMMEDYDRTMELVETAQDSAGRSSEQFAKYQDTVEYKLNQLKNTWEQLRVTMIDSNIFKGAIDSLTTFVKDLSKIDFKKLIVFTPIVAPLVKNFIKIFMDGISNSAQVFQQAGQRISQNILLGMGKVSNKFFKADKLQSQLINIQAEQRAVKHIENNLQELKTKKQQVSNTRVVSEAEVYKATSELARLTQEMNQLAAGPHTNESRARIEQLIGEIKVAEQELEKAKNTLSQASAEESKYTEKAKGASAALDEKTRKLNADTEAYQRNTQKIQAASQGMTQGFQIVGSAAVTAFAAMASGADITATLKTLFVSLAMQLTQMGIQLAAQLVAAQMSAKTRVALEVKTQGEITAAQAAGSAARVTMAGAEGFAEGAALGNGINAGLISTGVGAIIVGIALGITAIGLGIAALVKKYKREHQSLEEQVNSAKNQLENLQKIENEIKASHKEQSTAVKEAEELKEKYRELHNKIAKTTEEQEEYNQVVEKIRDQLPEIVTKYDEISGELTVQNDLWDLILEKQRKSLELEGSKVYQAKMATLDTEEKLINLDAEQNQQSYNLKQFKGASGRRYGRYHSNIDLTGQEWARNYNAGQISLEDFKNSLTEEERKFADILGLDLNKETDIKGFAQALEKGVGATLEEYGKIFAEDAKNKHALLQQYNALIKNEHDNKLVEFENERKIINAQRQEFLTQQLINKGENEKVASFVAKHANDSNYIAGAESKATLEINRINDNKKITKKSSLFNLGNETRKAFEQIGIETEDEFKKWVEDLGENADIKESIKEVLKNYYLEQFAYGFSENLTSQQRGTIREMADNLQEKTLNELSRYGNTLSNKYKDSAPGFYEQLKKDVDEREKELHNKITNITKLTGLSADSFSDWVEDALDAYEKNVQEITDKIGGKQGQAYGQALQRAFSESDLSSAQINNVLNSIDWSVVNITNYDEYKEKFLDMCEELGIKGGEKLFNEIIKEGETYGLTNLLGVKEDKLNEYIEKLEEKADDAWKAEDDFVKAFVAVQTNENLDASTYEKIADLLKEWGLNAQDYITVMENGDIVVTNAEGLKEIYEDQLNIVHKTIEEQRKQIQNQIILLQQEKDLLDTKVKEYRLQYNAEIIDIDKRIADANGDISLISSLSRRRSQILSSGLTQEEKERSNALKEQIKEYKEYLNSLAELDDQQTAEAKAKIKTFETDVKEGVEKAAEDAKKATEKVKKAIDEAEKAMEKVIDAQKKVQDALDKIKEKEEDVIEKTKELNNVLYGDQLHSNKLDPMYNYKTQLEQLQKNASRAKDSLLNMQSGDNANELLTAYMGNTHGEIVNRKAQNEVIAASIRNYESVISQRLSFELSSLNAKHGSNISTNVSDYMTKKNGIYGVNFQALNAAALPGEVSVYVEEVIETMNNLQKEIDDNTDAIKQKEKELRDMRKDALKRRVDLENQVVEALKAKAQEEVDIQKDKYDALKEADNDYLNALEDAINKQRELRERGKEWDELAAKEKKLSLMQRDTSGANAKEVMQLENEVQDTREQLLDKSVDDIIKGMKEMYELQQESREIELEYQEAMIDSTDWIKQATAIIDGWTTSDKMVTWFIQHATDEYTEGSAAVQELMRMGWEDTGNQMVADTQILTADLAALAETTQSEISVTVNDTSEMLTSQAELTLAQVLEKTEDAITKAEQALEDAIREVQNARDDYRDAIQDLEDAQAAAREAEQAAREAEAKANESAATVANNGTQYRNSNNNSSVDERAEHWNTIYRNAYGGPYQALDDIARLAAAEGYESHAVGAEANFEKKITKNAKGGLVDYTGLAWVDGTLSEPEAFLSAEDTKRIGQASELLASLPIFNGGAINNSVNNEDSFIEVHINIENISSDVDLDNALDKMKNAIWEAANPAGSSVILSK